MFSLFRYPCCLAVLLLSTTAQEPPQSADPIPRATIVQDDPPAPDAPAPTEEQVPPADEPPPVPEELQKAIPLEDLPEETRPAGIVPEPADVIPKAVPVEEDNPADGKTLPSDEAEPIPVRAVPNTSAPPVKPVLPPPNKPDKTKIAVSTNTDPNARPLSLRVPAPRGQIVDRRGVSLAQNRIAYYLGVQLPLNDGLKDSAIYAAAREPVAWVRRTLPGGWDIADEKILDHYHKRRWVPLLSAAMVPDDIFAKIKAHLPDGVVLRPFYLRTYPKETMASHLLGQMGKSGAMASGDILTDEYLWPPTLGKAGLEERFDPELTGAPGVYNVLYNSAGEKLSEDWVQRPTAGHTVVTSLDARFQAIVEDEMRANSVRGAFVIMDVKSGDVVAMSSNPGYNPNDWAYGISTAENNKYLTNKENPLIPRALQGRYPPASTFKIVTALAALDSGKVSPDTEFNCPKGMMFGRTWMWNHIHRDEGSMNVVRAIKRSCNPWFWQAARVAGGANVTAMATRLGFGEKTGICLPSMEASGTMPTPEFYQKKGGSLTGGVLANIAIGQGEVSATPLQVCQMMAGVARGDAVPRPRLVRQIQDVDGHIIQSFPPTVRSALTIDKDALAAVKKGMRAVVADSDGTGTRASNNYVAISGKTGTGEWHDNPKDYVAWFAGFIPSDNPEYAYAALVEGDPGDQISGGRKVAPFVGDVFNKIYKLKRDGDEMPEEKGEKTKDEDEDGKPSRRALASKGSKRSSAASQGNTAAAPPAPAAAPEPQKPGGIRGWWNRVRSKKTAPAGGRP